MRRSQTAATGRLLRLYRRFASSVMFPRRPETLSVRRFPTQLSGRGCGAYLVLSPFDQHLVGLALIAIAILLAISYFHTRRAITRAASALA